MCDWLRTLMKLITRRQERSRSQRLAINLSVVCRWKLKTSNKLSFHNFHPRQNTDFWTTKNHMRMKKSMADDDINAIAEILISQRTRKVVVQLA